ncbi:hypothetical protein G7Y89_g4043 [Cudoniella acicularis]|uniref:Uncharacterized protein n=1 Tax=Cudoniella acicularis TaxID=354080 RepID=A0A8H4W7T8_9HELO|nr:hypothetical protein G7Y89_g4043 [Cudoniella acicularis]
MQLVTTTLLSLLVASATLVVGAPIESANRDTSPNRRNVDYILDCIECGNCNGTSCWIPGAIDLGGKNHHCDIGSCTKQSGAGDGKLCGKRTGTQTIVCPGNGGGNPRYRTWILFKLEEGKQNSEESGNICELKFDDHNNDK